jgi:hypothetical protein
MQKSLQVIPFVLLLVVMVIAFMQGLVAPTSVAAIANAFTYAIAFALGPIVVGLFCASIGYLFGEASGWPNKFKQVWARYMGVAALLLIVGQVIPKH